MLQDLIIQIALVLLPIIFGMLGIKVGGNAALRAAAVSQQPKTQFPWADVVKAVLELVLKILSTPGVLKKKAESENGRSGQDV